jgi:4a-hydroxytetrahydrobiopterin dehydratase
MSDLAKKKCVPCDGKTPRLKGKSLSDLDKQLDDRWKVVNSHHLEREYKFKDFKEALSFTNRVGKLAEAMGHHPDILLAWGKVKLTVWTHSVGGLSENDFILAARADKVLRA